MKKINLTILGLIALGNVTAQSWSSRPSINAASVNETYTSRDSDFMIFTAGVNNFTESFITRDDGESWEMMVGPSGSIPSKYYTQSQDTLYNINASNSTGSLSIIYSTDQGLTWTTGASQTGMIPQWSSLPTSIEYYNNRLYISTDDSLKIVDINLNTLAVLDPVLSPWVTGSNDMREILEKNGDLFSIGESYPSVFRSTDNGLSWQDIAFGTSFTGYLIDIEFNDGVLYAADGYSIYEFDELNDNWITLAATGLTERIMNMSVSGDTIVTSNRNKHIHISTDHGATFEIVESFEPFGFSQDVTGQQWNKLCKVNDTYILGSSWGTVKANASDMIFASNLNGQEAPGSFVTDITVVNHQMMVITGDNLKYKYDAAEDTWVYLGGIEEYIGGTNISAYKSQLVRYSDTIYSSYVDILRTTDFGETWDTLALGTEDFPQHYAYMDLFKQGDDLYIGTTGGAYSSLNGGAWNQFSPTIVGTGGLCMKNNEMFLAQGVGELNYSTDNGATFNNIYGNLPGNVMDIKVAGNTVFAVVNLSAWSSQNEIWHSDNRNGIWVQDTIFVEGTKQGSSFDMIECEDNLIVTTERGLYLTDDEGVTWQDITYNLLPTNQFLNIDAYPREFAHDTLWAVGKDSIYTLPFAKEPLSINNDYSKIEILVYPNPTKDLIHVQTSENIESIALFDINGRILITDENSNDLNISELPQGIYYLRCTTSNGVATQAVIKE